MDLNDEGEQGLFSVIDFWELEYYVIDLGKRDQEMGSKSLK